MGILLAAGLSTRMGSPKPLARIGGRPLLELALENLRGSGLARVVVVVGHEASRIRREIDFRGVTVVENPEYADGLSSSIRTGLRAAGTAVAAYLFALGDQPFVSSATVDAILRSWEDDRMGIRIPTFRGRRGNPVLVDGRLAREIERVTGDIGFRALFRTHAEDIREVPVEDPGVRFDVDTPGSVESLEAGLKEGRPLTELLTALVAERDAPSP